MPLTPAQLQIYNAASSATVHSNRKRLAHALRQSRSHKSVNSERYDQISLTQIIIWHCCFIGWPLKLRPNGRYT